MSTQIIPTDKNGNIYYGPTSFKQCEALIDEIDSPLTAKQVADMMDAAGYTAVASKVRRAYGITRGKTNRYTGLPWA